MKKFIFIFILIGIFTSCSSKEEEKVTIPKGLIPRDSLVVVLIDIHKADAFLAKNKLPNNARNKDAFYGAILKKHGYSRPIFDSTVVFLKDYLDYYEEIYDDVLIELSKEDGYIEQEKAELIKQKKIKRDEKYEQTKTINHSDTLINTKSVTDSAFLKRVSQAKERFKERKKKRQTKEKK